MMPVNEDLELPMGQRYNVKTGKEQYCPLYTCPNYRWYKWWHDKIEGTKIIK